MWFSWVLIGVTPWQCEENPRTSLFARSARSGHRLRLLRLQELRVALAERGELVRGLRQAKIFNDQLAEVCGNSVPAERFTSPVSLRYIYIVRFRRYAGYSPMLAHIRRGQSRGI